MHCLNEIPKVRIKTTDAYIGICKVPCILATALAFLISRKLTVDGREFHSSSAILHGSDDIDIQKDDDTLPVDNAGAHIFRI